MKNLLLINFADARYGIWEDAFSAVRGALPLHRLPLSPPAIAGVAVLDDRSAVIADLAACLGSPPIRGGQGGTFLIIDAQEKIAGFAVEGGISTVEHPEGQVRVVPDAVRTQVVDTCVVIEGSVVPIINIRALHERLKQGILAPPQTAGVIEASPHVDQATTFPVRAFSLGGERFCVKAAGTDFQSISGDQITRLPAKNNWCAGITAYDDAVLPLVRLDDLLDIEAILGQRGMLIAGDASGRHGILVDEDLGIIEQQDLRISGLPALARRNWMQAAAVSKGRVYPLIEAGRVISGRAGEDAQEPPGPFTPTSDFSARFRSGAVDVVEFSLLGTSHAVPKDEVRDVHALLPISRIPHTPEIVMGVADLKGELLPVLDLAAVFGRRSAVNRKWRMIRIVNGDFHCLVVTETVRGTRRLAREDQKQLPLALPHQVLYGCYLDEGMVRLIMNVQSLAVHFEKRAVRDMVTSLSPELDASEERVVPVETRRSPAKLPKAAPTAGGTVAESMPVPTESIPAAPPFVVRAENPDAATVPEDQKRSAEEERRRREAVKARDQANEREEAERRRREDEARLRTAEQARIQAEAEAKQKALVERRRAEERVRIKVAEVARARAEEEAREREQETARRMAVEEAEQRRRAEADRLAAERNRVPEVPAPEAPIIVPRDAQDQPLAERRSGRNTAIAALLGAALVIIIYFVNLQVRQPAAPVVTKEQPTVVQKPSPPPVEAKKEAPATVKKLPELPIPPPLYLTVPPEMAVPAQNIYAVVKGDTLWGIAKRFTGNPLNYPRVARDNSIATPDLIFPGQRIKLVREKR
ncbi:MAG: chemotaxis protein CheW [Nitrospirota bacterium]